MAKRTRKYLKRIVVTPFQRFIQMESSGGILLIISTIVALIWANSGWGNYYASLWETTLSVGFGSWSLSKDLILWINDGLMCIFFFLVGLEIKREVIAGQLSSVQQAALPFFAAVGGMVIPALAFVMIMQGAPGAEGWGIPMATDIAFSLGILSLLGKRVPVTLKIFLTAFAIVDDIGAVLVIALFYTGGVELTYLLIGLGLFSILIVFNLTNLQSSKPYLLVGVVIWYFFLKSGIHPTIAGILSAFTIPMQPRVQASDFFSKIKDEVSRFTAISPREQKLLSYEELHAADTIRQKATRVQPPLQKLEHMLHPIVAYFVLPVFALANSGVVLDNAGEALGSLLTLGIAGGLLLGKTLGIGLLSWIGIKTRLARLPGDITFPQLVAVGMLGGVGFTMALFIANLAFTDQELLNQAKSGILLGSTLAGVGGYFWLRMILKEPDPQPAD